ncbi:MAG: glutathione-regulated potassium-efflux system protein KefB [Rhodospirillales bacterium]|jgi:monovalent cation:proton antiporter-2 (CPA2) family protein|nr:glutathione-regulated potassium-efflux system protein KefB [Rhodospirillales bacterium]
MSLFEIIVLLAAAIIAVPLAKKLGLGSVLGYLAAGVVVGPRVLGVVANIETIKHISEYGVVLLLFVIGLELKPSRLWVMRHLVFGMGFLQVAGTTVVLGLGAWLLGLKPDAAFVVGFGLSLSSTAFVLPMLAERKALSKAYGQASFSILLFQDLAVIPMLVLLPVLAGGADKLPGSGHDLLLEVGIALGATVAVLVGGRYLVRPLLRLIASAGYQEVFTAAGLLIVITAASVMSMVGLSASLGAFLAGVLLADSEYRHELEADIEPFKGLFLGLFFMGVGMSANLTLLFKQPLLILGLVLAVMTAKALVAAIVGRLWHYNGRSSRRLGFALAQAGEFGFVLWALAGGLGLLDDATADLLVLVVTLSMAATPLVFLFEERFLAPRLDAKIKPEFDKIDVDWNPVIIAGFGRVGQIVGRLLRAQRIPFTALDASPDQIDVVRRFGNKVYYGDASRLDLLTAAGGANALLLVLAIDDVEASVRALDVVKKHFPHLRVLARARNRQHAITLMEHGVAPDDVIRETFESAMVLAGLTLEGIGTPADRIPRALAIFRDHDVRGLRRQFELAGDEATLIQSAKQAAQELEEIFAADARDANSSEKAA